MKKCQIHELKWENIQIFFVQNFHFFVVGRFSQKRNLDFDAFDFRKRC